jgi:hypothetical protein
VSALLERADAAVAEGRRALALSPERVESMVSVPAVISAVEAELPR